ncbi:hypothetical protein [Sorangium sp. So ce1389]|uniref:hypothetical protein n=1 Tax=Sorangium sp. So ce1389 TaxID=3133336 RepID=UPI003F62B2D6
MGYRVLAHELGLPHAFRGAALDDTLRLAVPRSGNDHDNCSKAEPEFGLYGVCALDPLAVRHPQHGPPGPEGARPGAARPLAVVAEPRR